MAELEIWVTGRLLGGRSSADITAATRKIFPQATDAHLARFQLGRPCRVTRVQRPAAAEALIASLRAAGLDAVLGDPAAVPSARAGGPMAGPQATSPPPAPARPSLPPLQVIPGERVTGPRAGPPPVRGAFPLPGSGGRQDRPFRYVVVGVSCFFAGAFLTWFFMRPVAPGKTAPTAVAASPVPMSASDAGPAPDASMETPAAIEPPANDALTGSLDALLGLAKSLPTDLASGGVTHELPPEDAALGSTEYAGYGRWMRETQAAGGTALLVFPDEDQARNGYRHLTEAHPEATPIQGWDDGAMMVQSKDDRGQPAVSMDLVLRACRALVHIRIGGTADVLSVARYASQMREPLSEVVCGR